jgi:hypothetical protein
MVVNLISALIAIYFIHPAHTIENKSYSRF